jgi:hypothetical protein
MIKIQDTTTSFDGPAAMEVFRLITMVQGLKFEIKCPGMKLCRGPSCHTLAKRQYGLKGNKEKVLAALEVLLVVLARLESARKSTPKTGPASQGIPDPA